MCEQPEKMEDHYLSMRSFEETISRLLNEGIEFGAAFLPGETDARIFGSGNGCQQMTMEISPWLSPFSKRLVIGEPAGREQLRYEMPRSSTTFEDYVRNVNAVIANCRSRHGKTVYSRVICGELSHGETDSRKHAKTVANIASRLFGHHPDTLRFIYHTSQTGVWLGATPELLLDFDKTTGCFHTMAFAGTRKRDSAEPWDTKNIDENRFVIDFLLQRLHDIGATAEAADAFTVPYGEVEHICVPITGRSAQHLLPQIIDAINPTPALCGWPKDEAIKDIERYESHSRGCYGGFIGFDEPTRYRAFVNLRCMQTDLTHYCIYGGGGITADSEAEAEFDETSGKTALLRKLTGAQQPQSDLQLFENRI